MNAKTRRKLEMGSRALEFSRAHLDESSGYHAAVAQLEEQLQRSKEPAARQLEGFVEVRAASARKLELTRSMRRQQLVHLARVARRAAKEAPELAVVRSPPRSSAVPSIQDDDRHHGGRGSAAEGTAGQAWAGRARARQPRGIATGIRCRDGAGCRRPSGTYRC